MKIGISSPQDFLALLVRRRWWVIAPFIGLSCAAAILTEFLPKSFISETLILLRPRDVPQDFVKDLIAGSPQERLKSIEQTVLSRTNLIQILREFGDNLPEFGRLNMDEKVIKLRAQIHIDFEVEHRNGVELPLSYFRISYRNQNPELAQKIASKLTTLFIEADNKVRETQVFGTTEFLSAELTKVTDQLSESEAKLKDVKSSRQFELPDQRDANLRRLEFLATDRKTNAEALDRLLTFRLNLDREISETPAILPGPSPIIAAAATNPKVEEYRKAQEAYAEVSSKYTAKHPDVLAAKVRLDRLKEEMPPALLAAISGEAPASAATSDSPAASVPNPVYQKLTNQMAELKTELDIRQREKALIDSEIGKYNQRVENTPKTEQEIADVQRQNDDLKKEYEELKGHLSQARLSESLESKQKGAQFVIVDPANYPLDPDKPDKKSVLLGSCAAALAFSIVFAAIVDILRQKVWTQSQIEALWAVPVLVDIPEILTDTDLAAIRRKKFAFLGMSMASVLVYGVCLYGVYLKHEFILRQLDPLLQKMIYKQ